MIRKDSIIQILDIDRQLKIWSNFKWICVWSEIGPINRLLDERLKIKNLQLEKKDPNV